MSKEPKIEMMLYTLCLEGTPIAICALEVGALAKDPERTIRDAFLETWSFGGGDPMRLVGRAMMARPPTRKESKMWHATANETGKPYAVLGGGGEARGTA
jgi:hypothetical protein